MAGELLIPFGLNAQSGQLVDVASVKRGNACGCICPSCKIPLVARHGDEKEWHFGHRSRKVHGQTRERCDYSFVVAVRQMIRQISEGGLKFKVPELSIASDGYADQTRIRRLQVTEEAVLSLEDIQIGVMFSDVSVDLLGKVSGFDFVVYVTYKDRHLPHELLVPSVERCGVIELNISTIEVWLRREKQGRYKEALMRYLEEETDGKSWAYHPREKKLKEQVVAERERWMDQYASLRKMSERTTAKNMDKLDRTAEVSFKRNGSGYTQETTIGDYICRICNSTWTGNAKCKTCNTHLNSSLLFVRR